MSFNQQNNTSITDFKGSFTLANNNIVDNISIRKTLNTDALGNVLDTKFKIEYSGNFFISIDAYDYQLADVTELLLYLKDNLPGYNSTPQ